MKRTILAVFGALLFASAVQAISAQTVYDVEGVVYGPDAKPLANILMTLESHSRAQIGQDITNSDGRYRFSGITAGTYYISVKPYENQYQPILHRIELINTAVGVTNYSTERVDFTLKPVAVSRPAIAGSVFAQAVPAEAEKQYLSALKSLAKGDKSEATTRLNKAIEAFPNYFLALQQLGLLLVEKEKYHEALEPLRKAIEVNPRGAQSHLGLGMAYVNLDQPKEAIQELNTARSFDPKLFRAYLYLGMSYISVGDLDAAESSLKQAYVLGGPVEARAAHLYLASIYNTRKQYQKAITELEDYIRDNPKASNVPNIQEAIKKLRSKL